MGGQGGPGPGPDKEEIEGYKRQEAERRARTAEAKAASRSFPRLRLNVTNISPGYVTCSVFQSANAGTNWACSGTGITFDADWFKETFSGVSQVGDRWEFELVGTHLVCS